MLTITSLECAATEGTLRKDDKQRREVLSTFPQLWQLVCSGII